MRSLYCYINSSFICGEVIKSIQEDYWKEKFRPNKRLKDLLKLNVIFVISPLTEFEIRKRLTKKFNKTFEEGNDILSSFKQNFGKNLITVVVKDIRITHDLINWILKHDLSFNDGLHIITAQKLKIPLITSEKDKNLERWKKAYDGVYSMEEFWKNLKKNNPT